MQSQKSNPLRRPLQLLVVAVVCAFLFVRISVGLWAWQDSPESFRTGWFHYWLAGTVLGAVVLTGAGIFCMWIIIRVRSRDREASRQYRLAELGLLAGGLTHEIRNTLNAMRTRIAIARKQLDSDATSPAAQQIAKLEQAVEELANLTSDFLAFARPAEDNLAEIDVKMLITEVLEFTSLDLEREQVSVSLDFSANVPNVYADVVKLKRALLNLIINARQAMQDGGKLTIRIRAAGKRGVLIEVQDTGVGIPERDWSKIFETFYSSKPDGAGLGLAIVQRTVEDCGGRVTVDSQEGKGTTFRIVLPGSEERLRTAQAIKQNRRMT